MLQIKKLDTIFVVITQFPPKKDQCSYILINLLLNNNIKKLPVVFNNLVKHTIDARSQC